MPAPPELSAVTDAIDPPARLHRPRHLAQLERRQAATLVVAQVVARQTIQERWLTRSGCRWAASPVAAAPKAPTLGLFASLLTSVLPHNALVILLLIGLSLAILATYCFIAKFFRAEFNA